MLTNEELRAEAEAATGQGIMGLLFRCILRDAMTPERVLALLDEIDELAQQNARLKAAHGHLEQELAMRPER